MAGPVSASPLGVAVLISGTGSNLKTLIDAQRVGALDIDIRCVISNRATAPGLKHAETAAIPHFIIDAHSTGDGRAQDRAITARLGDGRIGLVVLAGYMRILGTAPVERFAGRMINLHPSLLPAYPGLDTYRRVLAAGDREHGASIHFVTPELDGGPVISQVRIPVRRDDDDRSLAARLAPREHRLLVATVELFAQRRVEMVGGQVALDAEILPRPLLLGDDDQFDRNR